MVPAGQQKAGLSTSFHVVAGRTGSSPGGYIGGQEAPMHPIAGSIAALLPSTLADPALPG